MNIRLLSLFSCIILTYAHPKRQVLNPLSAVSKDKEYGDKQLSQTEEENDEIRQIQSDELKNSDVYLKEFVEILNGKKYVCVWHPYSKSHSDESKSSQSKELTESEFGTKRFEKYVCVLSSNTSHSEESNETDESGSDEAVEEKKLENDIQNRKKRFNEYKTREDLPQHFNDTFNGRQYVCVWQSNSERHSNETGNSWESHESSSSEHEISKESHESEYDSEESAKRKHTSKQYKKILNGRKYICVWSSSSERQSEGSKKSHEESSESHEHSSEHEESKESHEELSESDEISSEHKESNESHEHSSEQEESKESHEHSSEQEESKESHEHSSEHEESKESHEHSSEHEESKESHESEESHESHEQSSEPEHSSESHENKFEEKIQIM